MLLDLLEEYDKIIFGNLNMVERMEDKTSTCGHILLDKKRLHGKN
jgi:hypothetical protein